MKYRTIFHIDDDQDDIDFFADVISDISDTIRCLSFTSATEAWGKLAGGELLPDIIFLDLNMPLMNGQEFLARLKESKSLAEIPVVILSTTSDSVTISQLKQEGASGFITKPSGLAELEKILRTYIL